MKTKEETIKLFEKNQRLVKYVYGKHFKSTVYGSYAEDLMQEGFIGLYQASKNFDETKGFKFSTYACKAIFCSMLKYKERYLDKNIQVSSLNEVHGHDENLELIDVIEDKRSYFTDIEFRETIKEINELATERDKMTLKLRLEGKLQREIAEIIGISQTEAARSCKRLGNIVMKLHSGKIRELRERSPRVTDERVNMLKTEARKLKGKGATYDQIAEILQIPRGSVGSYLKVNKVS